MGSKRAINLLRKNMVPAMSAKVETLAINGNATIGDADADAHTMRGTMAGYRPLVESVTANDTLTAAESGKIFVFADAAAVLTLPDSGGGDIIGVSYTFISNFAATAQEVKCTDTTNEKMIGAILVGDTDDITSGGTITAEAGDSFSSIEFTGATEGELGSHFTLTCYAADRWHVTGVALSAGTSATPFAAS